MCRMMRSPVAFAIGMVLALMVSSCNAQQRNESVATEHGARSTDPAVPPSTMENQGETDGNGASGSGAARRSYVDDETFPADMSSWALQGDMIIHGAVHAFGEPSDRYDYSMVATQTPTTNQVNLASYLTVTVAVSDVLGTFRVMEVITNTDDLEFITFWYSRNQDSTTQTVLESALNTGDEVLVVARQYFPEMYEDPPVDELAVESRGNPQTEAIWNAAEALKLAGFEAVPVSLTDFFLLEGSDAIQHGTSNSRIWNASDVWSSVDLVLHRRGLP